MATLPEGRVILCGHSMGGLLTAEVAFAAPPNRVIGFVAANKLELGLMLRLHMTSGIASLFKKKEGKDEAELNDPQHVEMVTKRAGRPYLQESASSLSTVGMNPAASTSSVYLTPPDERSTTPVPSPPPLPPRRSAGSHTQASNALLPPPPQSPKPPVPSSLHLSSPRPPVRVISPKLEQAFETFGLGPIPQPVHDVLHFFDKHSGIMGIKNWIVQIFEFGGCLLDPQGLIARYEKMQRWGSDETVGPYGRGWVNFWTITVPKRRGDINGSSSTLHIDEDRETDMAEAMDLSRIMGDGTNSSSDNPRQSLSPGPSVSSAGASSADPSLFQTTSTSSAASPPTTYAPSETTQSSRKSEDLRPELEALQAQMAEASISKEEKASLKEKEKDLKSEQKVLQKEEKAARKEEERQAKEAEKQAKKEAKERQKALDAAAKRARDADKVDSPHHFIVLPRKGTDQQWICVKVAGADSEVTAHCGLFFREENHEYEQMVADVGNVVRSFWDGAGGTRHLKM